MILEAIHKPDWRTCICRVAPEKGSPPLSLCGGATEPFIRTGYWLQPILRTLHAVGKAKAIAGHGASAIAAGSNVIARIMPVPRIDVALCPKQANVPYGAALVATTWCVDALHLVEASLDRRACPIGISRHVRAFESSGGVSAQVHVWCATI